MNGKTALERLLLIRNRITGANSVTVSVTLHVDGFVCAECEVGSRDFTELHDMRTSASVVANSLDEALVDLLTAVATCEEGNRMAWESKARSLDDRAKRIQDAVSEATK